MSTKINSKKQNKPITKPTFNILNFHLLFKSSEITKFILTKLDYFYLFFSTLISLLTHFHKFGEPNSVVFDEVYFGNFTNYYQKGEYFFDIHPPLGKQLLYLGSKILNYKGDLIFGHIGQHFPNSNINKIRFWPSLIASLITPIIYLTLRLNDVTNLWSFSVSLLPAFDNSMLVESRFVLIDSYLWFFASLSILLCSFLIKFPNKSNKIAIFIGIAIGSTVSIKFTGSGISFTIIFAYFINFPIIKAIYLSLISGIWALIIFILSFLIHFLMLPNPGPGCKFHSSQFCNKLIKKQWINPITMTIETIQTMLRSNFAIQQGHSYSSKWWQWPLMLGKGNWMWFEQDKKLWCVGSPLVWYFAFDGMLIFIILLFFKKNLLNHLWLLFGYLISYLPFSLVSRVMWNYHYIIPLIISLELSAIALNKLSSNSKILPILLILSAIISLYIYYPITYGTSISDKKFKKIMFKQWTY